MTAKKNPPESPVTSGGLLILTYIRPLMNEIIALTCVIMV